MLADLNLVFTPRLTVRLALLAAVTGWATWQYAVTFILGVVAYDQCKISSSHATQHPADTPFGHVHQAKGSIAGLTFKTPLMGPPHLPSRHSERCCQSQPHPRARRGITQNEICSSHRQLRPFGERWWMPTTERIAPLPSIVVYLKYKTCTVFEIALTMMKFYRT